jgi:hypothetical protein
MRDLASFRDPGVLTLVARAALGAGDVLLVPVR